jgi:subtilisin
MRRWWVLLLAVCLAILPLGTVGAEPVEKIDVLIGFKVETRADLIRGVGGEVKHEYKYMPVIAATLPAQAVEGLSHNPNVAYIEPDARAQALAESVPWGIGRIGANTVQTEDNVNGSGVKVGIIDTGIDGSHTDLAVSGGTSFVSGTTWQDDNGHGTHVAGTVAAIANNGTGVVGVAPGVSLYAIKVLDSSGSGTYSAIAQGIEWAVTNGMDVINMSLGGSQGSTTLEQAVNNAWNRGVVIVAAAGNSGTRSGSGDNIGYPAKYEPVIAVGSVNSSDVRSTFSSTGPALDIMAPGETILSLRLGGGTTTMSGTSMASPHVAGVAALVLAANPSFTNAQVRDRLISTAEAIGTGDPNLYGNGLVNAVAAVRGSGGGTPALGVNVTTNKTTYLAGEQVAITVAVTDNAGAAVSGAAVQCVVKRGSTVVLTANGTTDTSGLARFSYTAVSKDRGRTLTVEAQAAKTGYTSATGSVTFKVSR